MSDIEDKLGELIDVIDRAMRFGNSPFTNPATSGTRKKQKSLSAQHMDDNSMSAYQKTVRGFASVVKTAHGSIDDFTYSLHNVAKGFIELELAVSAFKAILDVGKTYSKMTDIGQNFNGSMFTMMQQVGAAGLSLDQFSALMTRNSRVAATIGVKSMSSLQLSVRDNLRQFGFYGMALDDVTNATSDYMETLREAGTLNTLTSSQQKTAIVGLISDASGLAQVFGTSREEIMKHTNEIMRTTLLQSRLSISTADQNDAVQKMVSMLSAVSPDLGSMAGEQYAKGGFVDTALGKSLINVGMGGINQMVEAKALVPTREGRAVDTDLPLQIAESFTKPVMDRLIALSKSPNASPDVLAVLKVANENHAAMAKFVLKDTKGNVRYRQDGSVMYDEAAFNKAMANQKKMAEVTDGFTKAAMVFEDAFRRITGQFLTGFYGAFASFLGDHAGDNIEASIDSLASKFNVLGTIIGTLLGEAMSWIGSINKAISWVNDQFGLGTKDKNGKSTTTSPIETLIAVVAGFAMLKAVLSTFMRLLTGKAFAGAPGIGRRVLSKVPFLRRMGVAAGAAEGALGGGCCDALSKGIGELKDRVDFHGDRAHEHATGLKGMTSTGLKTAAHGAETAAEQLELGLQGGGPKKAAAEAATAVVEKGGLKGLKGLGGMLLKGAGKMARFLPGVGVAMGGVFAAQRLMQGDYLGAVGEAAGGLSGLIPGIGWAADAAIQAGLLARDIAKSNANINATASPSDAPTPTPDATPNCPTDAYYHNGIATVDSTGSAGVSQEQADKDDATTTQSQLDRLKKMADDLQAAKKTDQDSGDNLKAGLDQGKLTQVLEDIRNLTNQQLQLQKTGSQKMAQAIQEQTNYGLYVRD